MQKQFNIQAYLKFTQAIEDSFKEFFIPVMRLKLGLKEAAKLSASADAPIVKLLQDFPNEIAKVKVPWGFEYCVHSLKAGEGWIQDVKRRQLLVKLIKHRTQEALNQMAISPAIVSNQPKLIEALHGFELVSKLGRGLEDYPTWSNLVSSLTTEAENLSSATSIAKMK